MKIKFFFHLFQIYTFSYGILFSLKIVKLNLYNLDILFGIILIQRYIFFLSSPLNFKSLSIYIWTLMIQNLTKIKFRLKID
jgi:hypothetical protein